MTSIFFFLCFSTLVTNALTALPRVQVDGDDEAVQTQHLGENKNENHSHEQARLLSGSPDAGVADDSDGVASGETGKTDGQAGTEVDKAPVSDSEVLEYVGSRSPGVSLLVQ